VFEAREIERERPVIFQEIGMVEDNPEELAHVMMGPAFWGKHPLGRSILGSKENILRFDRSQSKVFLTNFISLTVSSFPLPGMSNTIES
jgi:predicted Zn-dependent peptidase